jgi:hypothetical protein
MKVAKPKCLPPESGHRVEVIAEIRNRLRACYAEDLDAADHDLEAVSKLLRRVEAFDSKVIWR